MKFNQLINAFRMLFLFGFFKSGDEVVEVTVLKHRFT